MHQVGLEFVFDSAQFWIDDRQQFARTHAVDTAHVTKITHAHVLLDIQQQILVDARQVWLHSHAQPSDTACGRDDDV